MIIARAPAKVYVITFTNAAAYEFSRRLKDTEQDDIGIALDDDQMLAVTDPSKRIVCISGPGSGKTRTAMARTQRLCENAMPEFVGTLHSFCFRMIRRFGHLIGYGHGNISILPKSEQQAVLTQVRDRMGVKVSIDALYDRTHRLADQIWDEYYFTLKRSNLVDYDRMLKDGYALLSFPTVREAMHCTALVVEEAQDSAEIDWDIYELIPADSRFIIGDIDQAIFEWRKACPSAFLAQARRAKVVKLQNNYRCAAAICEAANNLIRHNATRYEKDTVSVTGRKGAVVVHHAEDAWQELQWVAEQIKRQAMYSPSLYKRPVTAILCRTNYEVTRVRNFMMAQGAGDLIYQPREDRRPPDWRRALTLMGLAVAPFNEILAEQFLRMDHAAPIVDNWKLEAQATGRYLSDRIKTKFNEATRDWQFLAHNGVTYSTIQEIRALREAYPPELTFADFLELLHSMQEPREHYNEQMIYTGTIHSAKGREFDVVFLPAFEESRMNDENEEEERRLAFVAITRAREQVYISYSDNRKAQWGDSVAMLPSRFIEEMKDV